jgi:hypothetical protein
MGGCALSDAYRQFLEQKVCVADEFGFEVAPDQINAALSPHARTIVPWLLRGGRRALFASFGLQKTVIQLETVRLAAEHADGPGLITLPLGVRQEFRRDAVERLGWSAPPEFIRSADNLEPGRVYLTNYETVRDGKLDPRVFAASSLDEAACCAASAARRRSANSWRCSPATAKRSTARAVSRRALPVRRHGDAEPERYIELLAYAAYLGIMDVSAAKTRFFKRNSEKADQLTIHPHKEREFWLWVSTWALFITKPSDLGPEFSDDGYVLPPSRFAGTRSRPITPAPATRKTARPHVPQRRDRRAGSRAREASQPRRPHREDDGDPRRGSARAPHLVARPRGRASRDRGRGAGVAQRLRLTGPRRPRSHDHRLL